MAESKIESYYFSFDPTGDAKIDAILSAVAQAGQLYHHTEGWGQPAFYGEDTPASWIQDAANEAALSKAHPTQGDE